jgi:hypothetical protein
MQCGLKARPYDLRHSFVSLLIHEGLRTAEVARQAGNSVYTCDTVHAHVFDEFDPTDRTPARTGSGQHVTPVFVRCSVARWRKPRERLDLALREEARSRTRTDDPFLTMEVLYQLSYPGGCASL